jgi:hypothetical protein
MPYQSKYKNKRVEVDGIAFSSILESNVYRKCKELKLDYTLQPRFTLIDKFKLNGKAYRAIDYVGDFAITLNNQTYIVDTKGMETDVFKIKKKLYAHRYQDEIVCIKSVKQFMEWIKLGGNVK